jgi:preprotein translocase subunit SecB
MANKECILQLLDLYFSKYDFRMSREDNNSEYNTSFNVEYAINEHDSSIIKVTIDTSISNSTNSISLTLQTIAIFKIEKNDIEEASYEQIMKQNTVAIIFPFIRSQISLLTTQPGMPPIILPPMNIAALLNS